MKAFFLMLLCASLLRAQEGGYADEPLWRQSIGGAVISRPVAQVESVVVATDGGNLRSYSSGGKLLWDYYARGRLTPHVSRSREGTSYICRTNGFLIAINRSGRELWRLDLKAPLISPVLIGWDGRLFAFTEKKLTCMTAAGYVLWSRTFEERIALSPTRDTSGGVIFLLESGEFLSFDPFGNAYSYSAERLPAAAASLEIEGSGPTALLLHEDRSMELVYTSLKYGVTVREKLELPSPPLAAAGNKGEAAVLLKDGRVALVSPEQRKTHWSSPSHIGAGELSDTAGTDTIGVFSLIFDDSGIYVLSKTGATGFAPDGRRLWTIRLTGAVAVPAFSDDGILYSGGADWVLYAYRLEDRPSPADSFLLYGAAPEGDYGTGSPGPSSWADHLLRIDERRLEERFAEIRFAIMVGNVGPKETEYLSWLQEIAGSFTANPGARNRPQPIHARHRAEAARLLAYIGSRETVPFLANLFIRDSEGMVKAAAAAAIGRIGVDPEGFAFAAFEHLVVSPHMDETTLTAVAEAAGALCRFSGPPLSDRGIRILTILSGYDRFPNTQRQAQRELWSLLRIGN